MSRREKKKSGKAKKIIIRILIILLLVVLICGGILFFYIKNKIGKINFKKIDKNELGITETTEDIMKDYKNIALLGIDSRYNDLDTANRTDCIIIASINEKTNEAKLYSIYRDTYMEMTLNNKTFLNKINQAYYGGVENTLKTINQNLDLNISEYVMVNFNAVAELVDAIDGIDIDIDKDELKWINSYIIDVASVTGKKDERVSIKTTGIQHLNGVQAMAYCRIRYTDGYDYKRTERMREVLQECAKKAKTLNLTEIDSLLNKMLPQVETNLSISDILDLRNVKLTDSFGWPYDTEEVILDGDFYGPAKTLETNVLRLHQEVYNDKNYVVPDSVKEISNKIIEKTGVKLD